MKPAPITIEEAQRRLATEVPPPAEEGVPLAEAAGAVLAADVTSDIDMPPFDKAMMDGYAVVAADTPGELEVIEEVGAGHAPRRAIARGQCVRLMTGAPLPPGADAVQQLEKATTDGRYARVLEAVKPGQNVAPRAQDLKRGDTVLRCGQVLRAAEIAVLATVGRAWVRVFHRPHCAMFATGDELVEPHETPGAGQIRNSNAYSVAAQVREMGLACDILPTARDALDELRARVREGMRRDVLLISGGVSAGDWDLVVPALEAEGVRWVVHQVTIRPGRPFFFGRRDRAVIFGLPGNPVSSFVTFEVFVRPFLGRMMGNPTAARRVVRALLTAPLPRKIERTQYLPAVVEGARVSLVPWHGSADIFALTRANALAIQPAETALNEGDVVDVMLL